MSVLPRVRELWPGITLSTDIIVGFCGETEQEFQHTLDLLEEIRFDVVHVAAYSVRPGTVAARWEDDVPLAEKKRRLHAVEDVQARIALELNQEYIDKDEEVLVEEVNTSRVVVSNGRVAIVPTNWSFSHSRMLSSLQNDTAG